MQLNWAESAEMKASSFSEVDIGMIPSSGHQLMFEGSLYLDDNIGSGINKQRGYVYDNIPVKLTFALNVYNFKGIIRVRVNLKEYQVETGQCIVIPEGSIVDYANNSPDLEFAMMAFSGVNFPLLHNSDMVVNYRREFMNQVQVLSLSDSALSGLRDSYMLLRHVVEDETITNKHSVLSGYIYSMGQWVFSELNIQKQQREMQKLSRNDEVFLNFMEHVQQHYMMERSVSYYADLAHLSPKYFGQIILKASGRNPSEWIGDMVILDAKAMLLKGTYTILEISEALNFPNSSFFAKYFKEHVGCAPGQFSHQFLIEKKD